ncbi:MAG TPA: GerMN domain-containing protein, partial [Trueperaceae bacterium]
RHTDGKTTEARLRQALGALVEGPTVAERARGLATTFPPDARLLDLSLQDGTLTVDMSGEFESGGGSATMIGRLNQLFYTATQPKDVQAVILEVEGEPVRLFGGEGLIVERPWRRPAEESLPVW